MLEDLAKFQVDAKELALLDSVAHMGTKNAKLTNLSKRPLPKDLAVAVEECQTADTHSEEVAVAGRSKKRRLLNVSNHSFQNMQLCIIILISIYFTAFLCFVTHNKF